MADVVVPTVAVPEAMPRYAMPGDAGADLTCRHDVDLAPGERAMVETGVRVALPDGYVGFVNPRSGLAARHGLSIVNAPGTIDSGYRRPLSVSTLWCRDPPPAPRTLWRTTMADVVVPTVAVPEAMPRYAMPGDAGADLTCRHDVDLAPGERAMVETGVRVALPDGYVGFVNPRSGLAARHGLSIVNAPGTIDSGYRGQINVLLVNTDPREPVHLDAGSRIAQLVVVPVAEAIFEPVEDLDDTERGQGGYGSTGVSAMPPVDG